MTLCEEIYFEIKLTGAKSEVKKFASFLKSGELDEFFEITSDYIHYEDGYTEATDDGEVTMIFANDDYGIELDAKTLANAELMEVIYTALSTFTFEKDEAAKAAKKVEIEAAIADAANRLAAITLDGTLYVTEGLTSGCGAPSAFSWAASSGAFLTGSLFLRAARPLVFLPSSSTKPAPRQKAIAASTSVSLQSQSSAKAADSTSPSRAADSASSSVKQLPMMRCAPALSPRPIAMAARGAPPLPTSMAKALSSIRIGINRPTPVSAAEPVLGICPM